MTVIQEHVRPARWHERQHTLQLGFTQPLDVNNGRQAQRVKAYTERSTKEDQTGNWGSRKSSVSKSCSTSACACQPIEYRARCTEIHAAAACQQTPGHNALVGAYGQLPQARCQLNAVPMNTRDDTSPIEQLKRTHIARHGAVASLGLGQEGHARRPGGHRDRRRRRRHAAHAGANEAGRPDGRSRHKRHDDGCRGNGGRGPGNDEGEGGGGVRCGGVKQGMVDGRRGDAGPGGRRMGLCRAGNAALAALFSRGRVWRGRLGCEGAPPSPGARSTPLGRAPGGPPPRVVERAACGRRGSVGGGAQSRSVGQSRARVPPKSPLWGCGPPDWAAGGGRWLVPPGSSDLRRVVPAAAGPTKQSANGGAEKAAAAVPRPSGSSGWLIGSMQASPRTGDQLTHCQVVKVVPPPSLVIFVTQAMTWPFTRHRQERVARCDHLDGVPPPSRWSRGPSWGRRSKRQSKTVPPRSPSPRPSSIPPSPDKSPFKAFTSPHTARFTSTSGLRARKFSTRGTGGGRSEEYVNGCPARSARCASSRRRGRAGCHSDGAAVTYRPPLQEASGAAQPLHHHPSPAVNQQCGGASRRWHQPAPSGRAEKQLGCPCCRRALVNNPPPATYADLAEPNHPPCLTSPPLAAGMRGRDPASFAAATCSVRARGGRGRCHWNILALIADRRTAGRHGPSGDGNSPFGIKRPLQRLTDGRKAA